MATPAWGRRCRSWIEARWKHLGFMMMSHGQPIVSLGAHVVYGALWEPSRRLPAEINQDSIWSKAAVPCRTPRGSTSASPAFGAGEGVSGA
jgi:hypothetical protein